MLVEEDPNKCEVRYWLVVSNMNIYIYIPVHKKRDVILLIDSYFSRWLSIPPAR